MADTYTRRGFGGALLAVGGLGLIGFLGLSSMATMVANVDQAVVVGDVVVQGEDGHASEKHGAEVVEAMLATLVGVVTGDPGWWNRQEEDECVDGRLRPQIKMGGEWSKYTAQFVFEKIADAAEPGGRAVYQLVTAFMCRHKKYLDWVRNKCHGGGSGPAVARGSLDATTL